MGADPERKEARRGGERGQRERERERGRYEGVRFDFCIIMKAELFFSLPRQTLHQSQVKILPLN